MSTITAGNARESMPALTALRFVAAFLVFLFHFGPRGPGWDVVASEGHIGVNIFFVLSGFLITLRYAPDLADRRLPLRDYFLRRIARILPLYMFVFVTSALLAGAGLFELARLPEWTLTQGLFGRSLDELVVPASWSLTVEECFYATAPLLYLALASVVRGQARRPWMTAAAVLLATALLLRGLGALTAALFADTGLGFLNNERMVLMHTFFGRFWDFAWGIGAALLMNAAGGRGLARLRGPRTGAAVTIVGAALLVGCMQAMRAVGGTIGPSWYHGWLVGLLIAPVTAALIVSLTSSGNPLARLLGAPPLVYLGQISYALYLVQLGPLGKGIFYPFLPRDPALAFVVTYAGVTLVSAVLFELVEEPARRGVLRAAGLGSRRVPTGGSVTRPRMLWLLAGVIAVVVAGQGLLFALGRIDETRGPLTREEVLAASPAPEDVLRVEGAELREDEGLWLARLPASWREGYGLRDERAPGELRVFADGAPVPFTRRATRAATAAFFRGPRLGSVALRLPLTPGHVLIVRQTPRTTVRLAAARLRQAPLALASLVLGAALAFGLAVRALGRVSPRTMAAAAFWAVVATALLGGKDDRWGLALLALEAAALGTAAALTVRRPSRSTADPPESRNADGDAPRETAEGAPRSGR